jgi:hypothetical protein
VDLRIVEGRSGLDPLQREDSVTVEAPGVDAFAGGEVGGELAESFAELAGGSDGIASFGVVESDGEVNEGLQEEAARAALRGPDFFPHFVTLEELAAVEEVYAAFEVWVHDDR